MARKIIISESTFHRLMKIMEADETQRSTTHNNFMNYMKLYQKLDNNNYFKNVNIPSKVNDSSYKIAVSEEMTDLSKMIYAVYESISHANNNYFDDEPTNSAPNIADYPNKDEYLSAYKAYNSGKLNIPTDKRNFYPGIYYLGNKVNTYSTQNKRDFLYQTRCFYTMIMRLYGDGIPAWANLFFNKKFELVKKAFLNCVFIAKSTLGRLGVGVPDENGNYPEGSLNWVRWQRHLRILKTHPNHIFSPLKHDIQPVTYKKDEFKDFMPPSLMNKLNQIMDFKKQNKDNKNLQKYFVDATPLDISNKPTNQNDDDFDFSF
jgi:hypothetical protein